MSEPNAPLAVTDSHALIWAIGDNRKRLGKRAKRLFEQANGPLCRRGALYNIPERGDRLIAATAAALDLPLITRDPEIAQTAGVECIWS